MKQGTRLDLARDAYAWELSVLEHCDLYLVGGTVRDLLLGAKSGPLDEDYLACGIGLDDLAARLEPFGELNLVGKSFGVIKFTPRSQRTVDISLPRTEYSMGPGHRDFDVRFDPLLPVAKDLERRDFTINSMALHLVTRVVTDPLGGMEDLEKRLLRVNRDDSFREDPLRVLRGVQLMARFELAIEERTRALMRRDGPLLATVSPERVRDEMNKMLTLASKPSRGFVLMHDEGILGIVFPELESTYGVEQNEYHPDDVFMHSLKSCDLARAELHLRWSALLHDLGKMEMKKIVDGRTVFYRHEEKSVEIAERVLERLRFPRDMIRKIATLVAHHMFNVTDDWSDAAVRRFIARAGEDNIDGLLALREADGLSRGDDTIVEQNRAIKSRIDRILASDAAFKIADLAISGNDVMEALGIGEGRAVGDLLRRIFEIVLENPEWNTREKLLELARTLEGRK